MDGVNAYLNNGNGREPTLNTRLLMQVLNATLARSRLAQYFSEGDVRRNINHECGYPETESITPEMLRELYDRDAVAARVVELLPDECWQVTPWVYEDEDPSEMTPFEQALDDVVKGLRGTSWFEGDEGNPLWEHLTRADCLCGVGSYGCILLGLDDGKDLWEPAEGIDERGQKTGDAGGRKLLFLREFDETLATIDSFEQDPTNPRYGQPVQYSLTFDDPKLNRGTSTQANTTKSVHWSRVIHVADGLKTSDLFGTPRLVPVFNRVQDLRKLYGGSAEMYWQGAFPGMAFVTHPQLGSDVALPTNLKDTMEEYRNGLQRYLGIAGTEPKMLSPTVVDPTSQIRAHLEAVCIRLGVPMRVFLGSERGELASSQDSRAWTDRLRRRQVRWITPRLICPVIDRLVCVGVLPQPERYLVEWPDIAAKTDQEKMQNALQKTQAIGAYIQGQLESIMTPMSYMTKVLDYNEEEAASILEEAEVNVAEKQALDLPPIGQEFGGGQQQNPFGGMPGQEPGGGKQMVGEDGMPLPPDEAIDAQAELDKQELEEKGPVPSQLRPYVPSQNVFCATGEGGGVDPSCSGKHALLKLDSITESGVRFVTGKSVTFKTLRNTEKAPRHIAGTEDRFQQRIEPAGRYLSHHPRPDLSAKVKNWEYGEATFKNPLVLIDTTDAEDTGLYGPGSWKARLSKAYGGKKGKALSRAIAADGYDGIVTVNPKYKATGEIVDLRMFHPTSNALPDFLKQDVPSQNVFCATGEGGGVDPTCGKQDEGLSVKPGKQYRPVGLRGMNDYPHLGYSLLGLAVIGEGPTKRSIQEAGERLSERGFLRGEALRDPASKKWLHVMSTSHAEFAVKEAKGAWWSSEEDEQTQNEDDPLPGVPIQLQNELPLEFLKKNDEEPEEPEDELLDAEEPEVDPLTGEPVEPEVDPITGEPVEPEIDPVTGLPMEQKSGYDTLLEEAKGVLPVRGGLLPSDHVPGLRERLLHEGEEGMGTASFDEEGAGTGIGEEDLLPGDEMLDEEGAGTATDEDGGGEPPPDEPLGDDDDWLLGDDEEVENVFCATGDGGGVDPSCGKDGGGASSSGKSMSARLADHARRQGTDVKSVVKKWGFKDEKEMVQTMDYLKSRGHKSLREVMKQYGVKSGSEMAALTKKFRKGGDNAPKKADKGILDKVKDELKGAPQYETAVMRMAQRLGALGKITGKAGKEYLRKAVGKLASKIAKGARESSAGRAISRAVAGGKKLKKDVKRVGGEYADDAKALWGALKKIGGGVKYLTGNQIVVNESLSEMERAKQLMEFLTENCDSRSDE